MSLMKSTRILPFVAAIGMATAAFAEAPSPEALGQALDGLALYTYDQPRDSLFVIEAGVDASSNDAEARAAIAARLAALLQDAATDKAAKQFACRMLERIGTPEHVPLLAGMLGDAELAECARRALEAIPGEAASAALRAALDTSEGALRVGVINALGVRRDAKAAEPIARQLASEDPEVDAAAMRALGAIGNTEAAAALEGAEVAPEREKLVEAALVECAQRLAAEGRAAEAEAIYRRQLEAGLPHLRVAALNGLADLQGAAAVPLLLDALASGDQRVRGFAATCLAAMDSPGIADALVARLKDLDKPGRVLAVRVLADLGGDAARGAVVELTTSEDEAVCVAALRALSTLGDASSVETLAEFAAGQNEAAREAAQEALVNMAGAEVDAAILGGAAEGPWELRVALLEAAVARRIPDAVPALIEAVRDGHHRVRLAGLEGLRAMAGAAEYPVLVSLLVDAPTQTDIDATQKAVLAAARAVEDPKAKTQRILDAFDGARAEVKTAMLDALKVFGGPDALEGVVKATQDASLAVRDAAVRALAEWPSDDVAPHLVQLVENSDNATHRALALRGALRLARARVAPAPGEALERVQRLHAHCEAPDAKRMLMAILGDLSSADALAIAASFIGDADVAAEARMTTLDMARTLKAEHEDVVTQVLKGVAGQKADPEAAREAKLLVGEAEFVTLFDGASLDGWVKPFDWGEVSIENGAIHLSGERKFFLVSEKTYGDFVLELEAYLDEGANSGIQYRSRYEQNKLWGYQADLDSLPRGWRGIYDETPGRGWLNRGDAEKAQELYNDTWNRYRVECIGDRTRFYMNAELIVDHLDPMEIEGHIALQHHGEEGKVVRFRNIRVMDLGKRRWLPLVDADSMAQWTSNGAGTWTIEDGMIDGKKTGDGYALLFSPKTYRDFCVRFMVRAIEGNAGFYVRSEKLPGTEGARGLQVEIDPEKDQAGLYETHGRNWVAKPDQEVVKKHFKRGEWNEMAVCAHGGRIVVYLNGHQTIELADDPGRAEGYFGLGLHSTGAHAQFRDVRILSE